MAGQAASADETPKHMGDASKKEVGPRFSNPALKKLAFAQPRLPVGRRRCQRRRPR